MDEDDGGILAAGRMIGRANQFSQSMEAGLVFSHRVLSETPEASWAQAFVTAVRRASWRLAAD